MRFCFELDAVADVVPWTGKDGALLNWFGLTSGRYWIETPLGEVLRYTEDIRKLWDFPFDYVDYNVARFFEDLQENLPAILEPVPEDVAHTVADRDWLGRAGTWRDELGDVDGRWDLYESAVRWWWDRGMAIDYLGCGPDLSFWRTRDVVHFRWITERNRERGTEVFSLPDGCISMSVADFEMAAYGFCEEILAAMKSRVQQIQREGWNRADCYLDVQQLVAEHEDRARTYERLKGVKPRTDWSEVRTQLGILASRMDLA